MQVGFYQLGQLGAEKAIAGLAASTRKAGERLLVVSGDPAQLATIGQALWAQRPLDFLANGMADQPHAARQPILLSGNCDPANGARYILFADGQWRDEGLGFERVFLLFGPAALDGARACWRGLDGREGAERVYWKFEDGKWRKGP